MPLMPRRLLTLPAIALAATLPFATMAHAQDAVSADTVVASVNGKDITVGHMIALREGLPPHYSQLPPDQLFKGILDQLVQQALLAETLKDDLPSRAQLLIENETRSIMAGAAFQRLQPNAASEEDIQAAYDAKYNPDTPVTEYRAAHILVETEDEAKDLISKLDDGADFAVLAREFSTGPSGPSGGSLGWFGPGTMVEPFFDAVLALEAGEVSPPVETQFGWHVITLQETRSKDLPKLEDVRSQLEEEIFQQAFEDMMKKLEAQSDVVRPDLSGIEPDIISNSDLLEQ
ncbi:peptidylprolyl isomerase [Roseovarius sp. 2305UL8-3]|uniref:peptidylprolyl isomerase n=1 Tax=Roseovarius conchicola TaxID=3121636 RepID=UPI003526FDAB